MTNFKSIKAKILIVLTLFVLLFIAIFFATTWVTQEAQNDSTMIDIAGRQRMLMQKITKECLISVSPQSATLTVDERDRSMALFQQSLYALMDGGKTYRDLNMTKPIELGPVTSAEARDLYLQVNDLWNAFKTQIFKTSGSKGANPAHVEKVIKDSAAITAILNNAVLLLDEEARKDLDELRLILLGGLIFSFILGIFLVRIVYRQLLYPVGAMNTVFAQVADGHLNVTVTDTRDDEIGQLGKNFNRVVDHFSKLIHQVSIASEEVSNSINEITSGSENLASRTNEEAASITQTSATLEELTAIVKQNRQNSEETGVAVIEFNTEIQAKSALMTDVTATMKEIHESGKRIDEIVRVINDISFQTNLLALNAAVEAARAGEAGRGFAVVAAEVRNLAQKTAESSKNIQEIVSQNVESTERGMELVTRTSEFFSSIVQVMQDILAKIGQITDGSKEQATGVEQINDAVRQLELVINQNAQLVIHLSDTTKKMKSHSMDLMQYVAQFNTEKLITATAPSTRETRSTSTKTSSTAVKTKSTSRDAGKTKTTTKVTESKPTAKSVEKETKTSNKPATQKSNEDDFFSADEGDFQEF